MKKYFMLITVFLFMISFSFASNFSLTDFSTNFTFDSNNFSMYLTSMGDVDKIKLLDANIYPKKVVPGNLIYVNVSLISEYPLDKIYVDFAGVENVSLSLQSGNLTNGVWNGMWAVHNTEEKEYTAVIHAVDIIGNEISDVSLTFFDPFRDIKVGSDYACALTNNNQLFCWYLRDGSFNAYQKVSFVSSNVSSFCVYSSSKVYYSTLPYNYVYSLGSYPNFVNGLTGVTKLSCGYYNVVGVSGTTAYGSGTNYYGNLLRNYNSYPTYYGGIATNVLDFQSSLYHTFLLGTNGLLKCYGSSSCNYDGGTQISQTGCTVTKFVVDPHSERLVYLCSDGTFFDNVASCDSNNLCSAYRPYHFLSKSISNIKDFQVNVNNLIILTTSNKVYYYQGTSTSYTTLLNDTTSSKVAVGPGWYSGPINYVYKLNDDGGVYLYDNIYQGAKSMYLIDKTGVIVGDSTNWNYQNSPVLLGQKIKNGNYTDWYWDYPNPDYFLYPRYVGYKYVNYYGYNFFYGTPLSFELNKTIVTYSR